VTSSFGENDAVQPEDLRSRIPNADDETSSVTLRREAWARVRPAGSVERLQAPAGGWDAGAEAADRAIDSGAGVLLLLDGATPGIDARAIAALYANGDATSVIPDTGDDLEWMRTCSAVRDAMVTLRPVIGEPAALLAHDPDLAYMVSALLHAAARRTPVVLAGPLPQIAAMAAQRVASPSAAWVFSALDDDDAAASAARRRAGITSWATAQWRLRDEGVETLVRTLVADLDAD